MTNASDIGLLGCRACGAANPESETHCNMCGHKLTPVAIESLQRTWAWLITSTLFYIPANTYPLLKNRVFERQESHTILEGIIKFYQTGDLFVATVILFASLVIPILKLTAIAYIALSIQFEWNIAALPRSTLYKLVEMIGRWSMVDVFVVVLLVALVQLGNVASVVPGIGVICFLLSVILAMFSANSIDPKLVWMNEDH